MSPPAAEVYRVDLRRLSPIRRLGSWVATLVEASSMVSTCPPWRDEARIVDRATGEVLRVVRNLVGGDVDDVGQVVRDLDELTSDVFERLWLVGRPGGVQPDLGDTTSV